MDGATIIYRFVYTDKSHAACLNQWILRNPNPQCPIFRADPLPSCSIKTSFYDEALEALSCAFDIPDDILDYDLC